MIFLYIFAALFPLIAEGLDHGLWLEEEVKKKLNEDWTFHFNTRQRWESDFWYHAYEPTFRYNLKRDNFEIFIGGGMREYSQKTSTKWIWVFMPLLETYVNFKFRDWELKQRIRGEYHQSEYGDVRYRLELFTPWAFSSIKPYISNEWFIRSRIYEDRFRIGLAMTSWNDCLTSAFFWQWRWVKGVKTYQLGFALRFSF